MSYRENIAKMLEFVYLDWVHLMPQLSTNIGTIYTSALPLKIELLRSTKQASYFPTELYSWHDMLRSVFVFKYKTITYILLLYSNTNIFCAVVSHLYSSVYWSGVLLLNCIGLIICWPKYVNLYVLSLSVDWF